jgi:rhodanese-related sulfurtransferase
MQSSREVAVGLFQDAQRAYDAIAALKQAGFSAPDVSLLVPASGQTLEHGSDTSSESRRGTRSLVAGAVLGGLGGWLAGLRAFAVPLVGPYIAAGAIAFGAGIGTILGGIASMRGSKDRGDQQDHEVVVLVHAGSRVDEAERILRAHGALEAERALESATP